jgi:cytochrome c-type biogenesis protein CcmF
MFFLTLLLFLTITGSVLIGSLLPTLTQALVGRRFEAGPEWFDRVTGPQFAVLALVMGVCPLLGRAALRRRGWSSVLGAVLVMAAAALAGFTSPASLIGFAFVGLAGGTALAEVGRDVAARSRRKGENPLRALWHLMGRNGRRYGGYLVHIGVILMAVGIIGTRFYPFETEVVLSRGEAWDVGDYTLVYEDLWQEVAGDHLTTWASLSVYQDGTYLTTLQPRIDQYMHYGQTVAVPALRPRLREDLYVVLAGWAGDGTTATLKVFVNPLASFLWLGGLVLLAGGATALNLPARLDR